MEKSGYFNNYRTEVFTLLSSSVTDLSSKKYKILEVGCGEGNFITHFEDVEYWAIESSVLHANKASVKGIKVFIGNFEEVSDDIPNKYFDIVVINDVMEHTVDHQRFLNSLRNKLIPDGVLVGSVPNVRFITVLLNLLIFKDWRYKSMGVLDYTHLRFFTKRSLVRSLELSGFDVISLSGLNPIRIHLNLKDFFLTIATFICGSDTKYMQYGFVATSKQVPK